MASSWRTKLPLLLSVEAPGCHTCSGVGTEEEVSLPWCCCLGAVQARAQHVLGALVGGNESPHCQRGLGFGASDWLFWFERQPVTLGGI